MAKANPKSDWKLPRQAWLPILILANLLLIALSVFYLTDAYRSQERIARTQITNFVSLVRLNLDSLSREIELALGALAAEPVTGAVSETKRLNLIQRLATEHQSFRTLVITDANGDFVGGTLAAGGTTFNIRGRDYYDHLRSTDDPKMVLSGPVLGRSNNKWSLVFARRLNDPDGKFAGIVLVGYAVERLSSLVTPLDLAHLGALVITKADHTVVFTHPELPQRAIASRDVAPEFADAIAAMPDRGIIPRLGDGSPENPERMEAYQRSADGRFYISASIGLDQIFGDPRRQAALLTVIISFMVLASVYFARRTLLADKQLSDQNHHLEAMVSVLTQDLITAKEFAEAANRAKSVFLANMSHELRTPMNAVIGMTEITRRHVTDPRDRERLDTAIRSANKLLGLIRELLDVSKIESERLRLEEVEFELGYIIDNLEQVIAPTALDKGIAFQIDVPERLRQARFIADPMRLSQILLHLLGNAVKFTEAGLVKLSVVACDESPADMQLSFRVEDSGIGISSADQKRLFLLFEQIDGSTTRRYGGTGLGLGLCKRLADLMGGSISVRSEAGAGSQFALTIRLRKALLSAAAPTVSQSG